MRPELIADDMSLSSEDEWWWVVLVVPVSYF